MGSEMCIRDRFNQKADSEKHMSSIHEADISFKCIECGADNKDIKYTNGHVISSFRCQTCRTDLTNEKSEDLYIFCLLGCESVISYGHTASVINHFRQVHTSYCEPVFDHVGYNKTCKLALDHMRQAHSNEANNLDDPTTVNTNEKKVKDPALEPDAAGRKSLDCELCDKRFHQRTKLEKHRSSFHGEKTGSEPVTCEYCGKHFPEKTDLRKHM